MSSTNTLTVRLALSGLANVEGGLSRLKSGVSGLGKIVGGVGAALAAKASFDAIGGAALAVAKLGGELSDLQARTGAGISSLVVLQRAFADSGAGAENVGKAFSIMQRELIEAKEQGGPAAAAISGLGLSVDKLLDLKPDEQFMAVGKAIGGIADPAKRTATAMAIFGRSGAELLPLFSDGGAIASAEASLGRLPAVLARNAATLDGIDDRLGHLREKPTQLFAGIADQLAFEIGGVTKVLDDLDLTPIGQKIGAFVGVAMDAWKAGEFGTFIGLTIEAGFELGVAAAKTGISKIFDLWRSAPYLNYLLTSVNELTKAMAGGITYLLVPLGAVAGYAYDALEYAFKRSANVLADVLEAAINKSVNFLNDKLGTSFKTLSLTRENAVAPSFGANWDQNLAGRNELQARIDGFFDRSTAAGRDLMGVGAGLSGEADITLSAAERLGALIQRRRELRDAEAKAAEKTATGDAKSPPPITRTISLLEIERDLRRRLLDLQNAKSSVEGNHLLTDAEKWRRKKALLTQELDLLSKTSTQLELRARAETDPKTKETILSRLDAVQKQRAGVQKDANGMGADPESVRGQMMATIVGLQNQFGTVAQQMAQSFASVFNSAIASISSGISGLIMRTQTWGQALASIGTSILTSIVEAIVQMGVRWILTQALMAASGKAIIAASLAATAPIASAQALIWAIPASLATIATYGSAAAAAPGLIGIANSIVMAQAGISGAFAEGGRPPVGQPALVGERDPELFVPDRPGLIIPADRTAAMLQASSGPPAGAQNASGGQPARMEVGLFMDQGALNRWVDKRLDAKIVRVLEGRSHQL